MRIEKGEEWKIQCSETIVKEMGERERELEIERDEREERKRDRGERGEDREERERGV